MRDGLDIAFVTGLHRSGTTFFGNVLASAAGTRLLDREPLNPHWGLVTARTWYPHRDDDGGAPAWLGDLRSLQRGRAVRWDDPRGAAHRALATARQCGSVTAASLRGQVLVIKDPFLSLALRVPVELSRRPVVVTMRHPVAWALSLHRMGWHPGWLMDQLLLRPQLCDVVARLGVPRTQWVDRPLVEAAAWAWTLLTEGLLDGMSGVPSDRVLLVPLETLRSDPVCSSLGLLRRVGLSPAADTSARLAALTEGEAVVASGRRQHVLQRDTRASIDAWRERVSAEDRATVWSICGATASRWYAA
jgi:hypothetical protein